MCWGFGSSCVGIEVSIESEVKPWLDGTRGAVHPVMSSHSTHYLFWVLHKNSPLPKKLTLKMARAMYVEMFGNQHPVHITAKCQSHTSNSSHGKLRTRVSEWVVSQPQTVSSSVHTVTSQSVQYYPLQRIHGTWRKCWTLRKYQTLGLYG
jgi:hypothetical protein